MPDLLDDHGASATRAPDTARATVADLGSPSHWVVEVDCARAAPADPWGGWVVEPAVELLMRLDAAARADALPRTVTAVVRTRDPDGWTSAVAAAAADSMRGVTGAVALELGPRGVRANALLAGPAVTDTDVRRVVEHLHDASFTTGSTVRLGATTVPPPSLSTTPEPGPLLLTGAAGGIGEGVARTLARDGWELTLSDLPGPGLDEVAARIGSGAVACDVTDPRQVADVAAAARDGLAGLAILHGVGTSASIGELDEQDVRRGLAINGTGVHDVLRALAPRLVEGAPSAVVVLSSQAGLSPEAHMSIYCAAKFAVVGLVTGLAPVLARDDVRIHALCPGPVDTPLMRAAFRGIAAGEGISEEQYTERRLGQIPARRFGTPTDMGDTTAMLLGLASTGVVAAPTGGEVTT